MNKLIIVTIALTFLFSISCHAEKGSTKEFIDNEELNWLINLEEAVAEALASDKPILLDFTGSDWCGWCKRLHSEVFSQTEFIDYAQENLILLKLDFPKYIQQSEETKKYNNDILSSFGVRGFPTIVLLDSEGKEINRTGYQPGGAENYIKHLESLMKS